MSDSKTYAAAGSSGGVQMPDVARVHKHAGKEAAKRQAKINATLRGDPDQGY